MVLDWVVGRRLGSGAYGEVHQCFNANRPGAQHMAVKQLHDHHRTTERLNQLESEFDLMKTIKHAHIIDYDSVDLDRGRLYMEYVLPLPLPLHTIPSNMLVGIGGMLPPLLNGSGRSIASLFPVYFFVARTGAVCCTALTYVQYCWTNVIFCFYRYAAQGTLESHINGTRLDSSSIRRFTAQILLGLEYLYDKGIIHEDLK